MRGILCQSLKHLSAVIYHHCYGIFNKEMYTLSATENGKISQVKQRQDAMELKLK